MARWSAINEAKIDRAGCGPTAEAQPGSGENSVRRCRRYASMRVHGMHPIHPPPPTQPLPEYRRLVNYFSYVMCDRC